MLTKRNDILELWRFIFCIMVLGLHFSDAIKIELFNAGYLGVEFFFLVSGYFIGSFYSKQIANKTIPNRIKAIGTYICSRLKRLYPLYLVALFFMLFMRSIINNYHFGDILTLAKSCFAEFILLQWTPIGKSYAAMLAQNQDNRAYISRHILTQWRPELKPNNNDAHYPALWPANHHAKTYNTKQSSCWK